MKRMRHSTQELDSADSLLASITSEEQRQEERVQSVLAEQQTEYQDTARRLAEEEMRKDEQYLTAAREDLRLYAETEPKAVLEASDAKAKVDAAAFNARAKKNAKKTADGLLTQLLSLSFLSR